MRHTFRLAGILTLLLAVTSCQKTEIPEVPTNVAEAKANNAQLPAIRTIDLENAYLASNLDLNDDGINHRFITKGTYHAPEIIWEEYFRGCHSIAYTMPPTTASGSNTTDKSQHRIFGGSESIALPFGVKRYFGFAIKLDWDMQQPTSTVQVFQIWQGTPMSPPLELRLMPGGSGSTFNYQLRVRNNSTTANPSAGITVCSGTIHQGEWNSFVLMTILRSTSDSQNGEIKLWQNGSQVVQWFGRCGYTNGIVYAGNSYTPNAKFDAFFGPYRPCQQAHLRMYFDEVRYGGSYAETDPDAIGDYCY
jgi:Polysaccharide lyase